MRLNVCISALLLSMLSATAAAATTSACRLPQFAEEVQCGQVLRPLDPAHPDGKKIAIHYVVIPSQDRNKRSDAVFFLAGGPGQSAIQLAAAGKSMLGRLNRRRDLVFVDQRGTGQSAPLQCPRVDDESADVQTMLKNLDACKQQLQRLPYGDLKFFSTPIAVQDLDAVRQAQGYETINLVGISYGTRVGLEYLRQYPKVVRRLVIDGVVPPTMPLLTYQDAHHSLQALFDACELETACQQAYPHLAQRWQQLLSRTPFPIQYTHPRLGTTVKVNLSRIGLVSSVFKALYGPNATSALPYAITQAEAGNFSPLMTLSGAGAAPSPTDIAVGMHYSVLCGESLSPHNTASKVLSADEFSQELGGLSQRACAQWPLANIPAVFFAIPPSQSAVLLLSGGIDPVTPTHYANDVAKALGDRARHIEIAQAGHGQLGQSCVNDVAYRFINADKENDAVSVDAKCVRQIPRPLAWLPPKSRAQSVSDATTPGVQP